MGKKAWTEAGARWAAVSTHIEPEKREWVLSRKTHELYLGDPQTGGWMYAVNLDECNTSAGVLDWIAQVAEKTWATNDDLANLVRALHDILDFQTSLCGQGKEHGPIDVKKRIAGLGKEKAREDLEKTLGS
jgi:hypothetical protein